MKILKRIAMIVLSVCLVVPCFSMLSHAADGRISFSDHVSPVIATGAEVKVRVRVAKTQGTFVDIDIVMTYDTDLLEFKGGEGMTEETPGTIHYVGDARNDGSTKEFYMTFRALKAGTAVVRIKSSEIRDNAGAVKDYTEGTSTIKIEGETVSDHPGNLSKETVEVNGVTYRFAAKVPKNEIPEGFKESTLEYGPAEYNVIYNEDLDLYLAYLVDEDNAGELFMYVDEDATFAPYRSIQISEQTMIVLLSNVTDVYLPEEYKFYEDAITVNGQKFPGWKLATKPGYCIIYALNNHGQKTLYELDAEEGTYQRFDAPEIVRQDKSLLATLTGLLQNHLDRVIIIGGFTFLFLILLLMILSVKLYNRNAELDEMYDKYGFDDEDDEDDEDDDEDDQDDDINISKFSEENEENQIEAINLLVEDINEFLPKEMQEIFPEEPKANTQEVVIPTSVEEEIQEETLGKVLAKQKQEQEQPEEDALNDEDMLENFMMDFIDLDD